MAEQPSFIPSSFSCWYVHHCNRAVDTHFAVSMLFLDIPLDYALSLFLTLSLSISIITTADRYDILAAVMTEVNTTLTERFGAFIVTSLFDGEVRAVYRALAYTHIQCMGILCTACRICYRIYCVRVRHIVVLRNVRCFRAFIILFTFLKHVIIHFDTYTVYSLSQPPLHRRCATKFSKPPPWVICTA